MRKITLEKIIRPGGITWKACRKGKPFRIGDIVQVSSCDNTLTCIVVPSTDCSKCTLNFYKVNKSGYRYETCPLHKDGSLLCRHTAELFGIMFMSADKLLEEI